MWSLLLACQEPFDQDRHDLVDFRIAGMAAEEAPTALLWAETGLWSATAPSLVWTSSVEGEDTVHTLVATDAEGHQESGRLVVEPGAHQPGLVAFTREEGWSLAVELDREASTHFMAPAGEFSETGPQSTDWDPAGASGIVPVIALSFDGFGGVRWDVLDVPVDVDPPWLELGGRIFPTELEAEGSGWWAVSLEADEGWAGLRFADPLPATGPEEGEAVCGGSGDFDPGWLAEGRCGRDEILGARVVVEGTGVR